MKRLFFSFIVLLTAVGLHAAEPFVVFNAADNALSLRGAAINFSADEHSCVQLAAANLQTDMERVTGLRPELAAVQKTVPPTQSATTILVGTAGVNRQIDQLMRSGQLPSLKGKTEMYVIKTIGQQLVIAGSDKRGTVFGIYELSRQIGVSPWYYWADVPIAHHEELYVCRGEYTDGEPAVRYRGLFLNDEAPCLTSWVKNTFGTNYGDHRFYEKVFELILRLKGNYLWPAMWSWAFYADDPENLKTADAMGIMMGTSHHEPMARNHQEYARDRRGWGAWNYATNQQSLDRFFREGIERMKGTDDIVTIGMRGDGDEAMGDKTDTRLMEKIITNQRKIIQKVTGRPARQTPQLWALYKEVQDYYDAGLRVPDDVTILLCDDNWGNVRRIPTPQERLRKGGWGLYYHVDYVGAPRNSKWLNVTPMQNMWEQLSFAYDSGIQRLWILNVGDLKPMEFPITMFMEMAWNPHEFAVDHITDYALRFCREAFGESQAQEAARILNLYCKYAGRSTTEMLDATTYNLQTGEWQRVADDFMRLEAEALRQYLTLDAAHRDAYQQLVLFPVQALSNVYQMYYAQAMNLSLASQGNPDANRWAERVEEAFRRDSLLCAAYNHDIAGGKWDGMMTQKHIGYTSWNDDFPADRMPKVKTVAERLGGWTFQAKDGYVAMEAEHYYEAKAAPGTTWTVIPFMGRTRSAMALMPYTQPTGDATLSYRFTCGNADRVKVHVIVKSTLDYLNKGGLTYTLQLDGVEKQRVNFNSRLNEAPENIYSIYYPTVARRVVESVVELPLDASADTHLLTLHPDDPAIVFEKIVVDAGGYQPQFLFGEESPMLAR